MKLNIIAEAVERCLDELYRYSQPSITWDELNKLAEKEFKETGKTQPVYERFYLSNEEYKIIVEKYLDAYNLKDPFRDYCDLLIRDMIEGCIKDKYIKGTDDSPGYRDYENVPSLDHSIGKENLEKVVEFINMRKNFYRFRGNEDKFTFNVMNYSPSSNKQTVIDYWKSQGKDIEIEDRNEDEMWEVHYHGMTWDEWNEENKEYRDEEE